MISLDFRVSCWMFESCRHRGSLIVGIPNYSTSRKDAVGPLKIRLMKLQTFDRYPQLRIGSKETFNEILATLCQHLKPLRLILGSVIPPYRLDGILFAILQERQITG